MDEAAGEGLRERAADAVGGLRRDPEEAFFATTLAPRASATDMRWRQYEGKFGEAHCATGRTNSPNICS